MATQLFKKNESGGFESTWAQAERVAGMLASGWCVDKKEPCGDKVDAQEETSYFPTKEEADTNKTGKLSNKEVRQAAKLAGIEDWQKIRVGKLKELLGYDKG